jgi:hypothetical protein
MRHAKSSPVRERFPHADLSCSARCGAAVAFNVEADWVRPREIDPAMAWRRCASAAVRDWPPSSSGQPPDVGAPARGSGRAHAGRGRADGRERRLHHHVQAPRCDACSAAWPVSSLRATSRPPQPKGHRRKPSRTTRTPEGDANAVRVEETLAWRTQIQLAAGYPARASTGQLADSSRQARCSSDTIALSADVAPT